MTDRLLLRFRDLTPDVDTVSEHNKLVQQYGGVLWGWWRKPLEVTPDPGLSILKRAVEAGQPAEVLFVNSANREVFKASLRKVHYEPGGGQTPPPNPKQCPSYYRKKELPAWFEVGEISEVSKDLAFLKDFIWSKNNRVAPGRDEYSLGADSLGRAVPDLDFLSSNVSLWLLQRVDEAGSVGISELVPPLSLGAWPIRGSLAIHLSDLHFGPEHAFRNHLDSRHVPRLAKETMVEALLADLRSQEIGADEVALLLVTGDLTWSSEAHEFENAHVALSELANRLGLHRSQVVIIPGNHDVEWRAEKEYVDPNAELNYRNFCSKFYGVESSETLLRVHQFRFEEDGRHLTVLGLNSCRLESKENAGLGFVGREQLQVLYEHLRRLDGNRVGTRLALLHHHLVPVSHVEDIPTKKKGVSLTLDAEAVLRSLIDLEVEVVLHGHQHQPFCAQSRRVVPGYASPNGGERLLDGTLTILGGGSIGVKRKHMNLIGRNAYTILDLSLSPLQAQVRQRSPSGPGFIDYGGKMPADAT